MQSSTHSLIMSFAARWFDHVHPTGKVIPPASMPCRPRCFPDAARVSNGSGSGSGSGSGYGVASLALGLCQAQATGATGLRILTRLVLIKKASETEPSRSAVTILVHDSAVSHKFCIGEIR